MATDLTLAVFKLPQKDYERVLSLAEKEGLLSQHGRPNVSEAFRRVVRDGLQVREGLQPAPAALRHALTVGLATLKSAEVQDART